MGHIRLGTLQRTKKWRDVIGLLDADTDIESIAEAAARASESDLKGASDDPFFQLVTQLLVRLPLSARAPGFEAELANLGLPADSLESLTGLLSGLNHAINQQAFEQGHSSDAGELARTALLECLSVQLSDKLPTLLDPTAKEVRKALASFSSGKEFSALARDFFARLSYRSLDYYLSRELANHIGPDKRFENDGDRVAFEVALRRHTFEASKIVESFAGGWYGKTVWKEQSLSQDKINEFTRYAFKKLRSELGQRRATV